MITQSKMPIVQLDLDELGDRLRTVKDYREITYQQLSNESGVSMCTVYKVCNHTQEKLSATTYNKLVNYVNSCEEG